MAKVSIGSTINTVAVEYGPGADNQVESSLVSLLRATVKSDVASGHTLNRIYVSATTNGAHESPRHASGQAIDMSRINGQLISVGYSSDPAVKAIVDALQDQADAQAGIRENFGPHLKHKHGSAWGVSGHADHIHWSVD
jgi:hypothetical protein